MQVPTVQAFDKQSFDKVDKSLIRQIFISDLHLSPNEPDLTQAFLALLDKLNTLPNLEQLFILGDWFEAWLGDDVAETGFMRDWLTPMLDKLIQLTKNGCQIFVMHGNRDFLIGQSFCDKFGGRLIQEPYYLKIGNQTIRLEHGDSLCIDDKKYQRFRKIIRNPLIQKLLLALPIKKREQIAHNLRQKSKLDNAKKSMRIMDINETAVNQALENADILIHGHTHRPAVHELVNGKRMVLGDWRVSEGNVEAVIGVIHHHFQLAMFTLSVNR
ncbi:MULTISPECIES: UDP-2,3-diacylglucosamine diphosphatase [unclassified Moraxella]|uniref:UDP-2,3-diacylglucosamine diphosphatase n=1 Tax=unclassified Moraxella TaxID=2685852 RepID=UPI003AF6505B